MVEHLDDGSESDELNLRKGAVKYIENLVKAGADPQFASEGATNWVINYGAFLEVYRMVYNEIVKPCLDKARVGSRDRSFYDALTKKLVRTLISITLSVASPKDFEASIVNAINWYINAVPNRKVAICIKEMLGIEGVTAKWH